jgi:hypothetical protein
VRRIPFNHQFVNEAGNDLVPGKIHTIRCNYNFWIKFQGQELALYTWEDKPYRSKQNVFCIKRLIGVQKVRILKQLTKDKMYWARFCIQDEELTRWVPDCVAENDGFSSYEEFEKWFENYPIYSEMAILHFTDCWY